MKGTVLDAYQCKWHIPDQGLCFIPAAQTGSTVSKPDPVSVSSDVVWRKGSSGFAIHAGQLHDYFQKEAKGICIVKMQPRQLYALPGDVEFCSLSIMFFERSDVPKFIEAFARSYYHSDNQLVCV